MLSINESLAIFAASPTSASNVQPAISRTINGVMAVRSANENVGRVIIRAPSAVTITRSNQVSGISAVTLAGIPIRARSNQSGRSAAANAAHGPATYKTAVVSGNRPAAKPYV